MNLIWGLISWIVIPILICILICSCGALIFCIIYQRIERKKTSNATNDERDERDYYADLAEHGY